MEQQNTDFDLYVQRYCVKHEIAPEEAIKHRLVQEVKTYYDEKPQKPMYA